MSIQGVGPTGLPGWIRGPETTRESGEAGEARRSPETVERAQVRERAPVAPAMPDAIGEGPESIPEGVDAELWSVLTSEERAHFAKFAAMGGVTYGPNAKGPSRPPVQGHRLDLRI